MDRVVIKLKRKHSQPKTRGKHSGGEHPAPKKIRRKNPKAHTGTQRNMMLVLNREGKFIWRQIA